jgi:hypothetical protein
VLVAGTSANDVINVRPGAQAGFITVTVDGSTKLNQSWASLGTGGLLIDGNGGNDTVNIGNGNLSSFAGKVFVQDTGGKATITIDDSADSAPTP